MDAKAQRCRRWFLKFFRQGFHDQKYLDWERGYKWQAHEKWTTDLGKPIFENLLSEGRFAEIASRAVRIESATNLLFSFEKMALRDAVKSPAGAEAFARGLYDWVHGSDRHEVRFERFTRTLGDLPRRQTRVLTWPLLTVFGFLAAPKRDIFLKPLTTRAAAADYGFDFSYASKPGWETYANLLEFAHVLRRDLADLKPRDMIDIQGFIWVLGSAEYREM